MKIDKETFSPLALVQLLVRRGLNVPADWDVCRIEGLSAAEWTLAYRYAAAHGLAAVAWDGLSRLVDEGRADVPKEVKLRWYGHAMMAERRYASHKAALLALAEALTGTGIRLVVMKGASVAERYQVPAHRECGDVDVWPLGGSAEAVRDLMKSLGAEVGVDSPKHIEMVFRGVTFEVHREFVTSVLLRPHRHLNVRLAQLAAEGQPLFGRDELIGPSAAFDALFLTAHAANHFKSEGIIWRHIVDAWLATGGAVPVEAELARYGLARFGRAVYDVGRWFLGDGVSSTEALSADASLLKADIEGLLETRPKEGGLVRRKWQRFWSRRKVCRLAGEPFYKVFWRSVWEHLRQPASVGRGVG